MLFHTMKKGIWLSLIAAVLIGIIVLAIGYLKKREELANNSKESFIPSNSAVVIGLNTGMRFPSKIKETFASDISRLGDRLLFQVADTLIGAQFAAPTSRIVAARTEGKKQLVFLFVMDNKDVLSRKQIVDFLKTVFSDPEEHIRKYDRYKIYRLSGKGQEIYYAVEEGMILLSDSELYIEDALKQFDQEQAGEAEKGRYKSINKYFSSGAGMNVFLNANWFKELLPMYLQTAKMFPQLDVTECFKWGALDGDWTEAGIVLNGFMSYEGMASSYMKVLEQQRPRPAEIDRIIPGRPQSFFILNLSDVKAYLTALENYRFNAGFIEKVRKRKQEYDKLLRRGTETELKELLQGEFALVNMSFDENRGKQQGLVIASLKSGSLCRAWLEKMIGIYARSANKHPDSFRHTYQADRDKSFTYYTFPWEDMAAVYWGYLFDGIENRFAFIEDNYLVLASSEKVLTNFLKDYMHRVSIRDTEWYKKIRNKLSSKYNLAYFAETASALSAYKYFSKGDWKAYLSREEEKLSVFSTFAMQWSSEGNMLYNTVILGTEELEDRQQPHVMWQTKLDAPVSMKPASVLNHVTGERELLVQDDKYNVYLINDVGRVLWKLPLEEKINSEIYQVDAYKNGKLQYLFSTPSYLYLVDRNGHYVPNFPVKFRSTCERGITLFDYDKDRNYRIFAPGLDQEVRLYDIKGKEVKGWDGLKADKPIMSRVEHFRVEGKDYVVFADQYRLYILDRKGKERVRVSEVFDIKENTPFYLTEKEGKVAVAFADRKGRLCFVDFTGKVKSVECGTRSPGFCLNVADVNNDGQDEFIFTDGGSLKIYSGAGKPLFEKEWEADQLDFPYVYRFSAEDIRIGLLDRAKNRMMLFGLKEGMSKGFPLDGDSPFSIVFGGSGDFYLFAGADRGGLIKYKVQR